MDTFLIENIESLRKQMIEESIVHESLTHENIIAISQKLDDYIVMYQHLKASKPYAKARVN